MSEKNNVTANKEETALTTGGFAALANAGALNDATKDLAGLDLTFDRIKIPAGGSTAFEIPDGDSEEVNMVKEIVGVILLHHPAYAYYKEKYTGGSNPPDCGSFDGVNGPGDPACVNESRVMRLPRFNHCKEEPVMVECISFHPERSYTQDQLSDVLPVVEEQLVENKKGTEKGLSILTHECDFIKHYRDDAASLSEHH